MLYDFIELDKQINILYNQMICILFVKLLIKMSANDNLVFLV